VTSRQLIDWDLATSTAVRLVRPDPTVSAPEAAAAVADLRGLAVRAESHVRAFTGLGDDRVHDPVAVVDRPGWIRSAVGGFRVILAPLTERLLDKRGGNSALGAAVGSRITGFQLGAIVSYLASRVLGQYELFLPPGEGEGRLTLVAPNIVEVERRLGVDAHDFRLWVCLHEVTHRAQFTAVPWLKNYLHQEIGAFLDASDLDPSAVLRRLRDSVGAVAEAARGRSELSLLEAVQTPAQRVVLDRLTGVMSLVEGHGEYVMDGVGPDVVSSVAEIRRRFDERRRAGNPVDRAVRRLLGLDLKMKQYAEGERFVRAVVAAVGMPGFNQVWTSPQTLPTRAEIRDPGLWIRRVHGIPGSIPA
jgi:putative hydrolase/uncharacterized protein, coenzyme F420 biosynthesis associated